MDTKRLKIPPGREPYSKVAVPLIKLVQRACNRFLRIACLELRPLVHAVLFVYLFACLAANVHFEPHLFTWNQ